MGITDEALMRAVREGDLFQLAPLFDRYHVVLFEFLSRITGSRHLAEDLVQEVFLRILKYRETYRDDARFETWIYRIARNARADYLAKRSREQPLGEEVNEYPDGRTGPEGQLELDQEIALLQAALMQLREDRRELLVLVRYQGMKYEAISELLDVEIGTVKVRVYRALNELREAFQRLLEKPSCDVKTSQRSLSIT